MSRMMIRNFLKISFVAFKQVLKYAFKIQNKRIYKYQPMEDDIEKSMKLEASNPLLPQEICVATVKDVIGSLLSITLDHAPHINLVSSFYQALDNVRCSHKMFLTALISLQC